ALAQRGGHLGHQLGVVGPKGGRNQVLWSGTVGRYPIAKVVITAILPDEVRIDCVNVIEPFLHGAPVLGDDSQVPVLLPSGERHNDTRISPDWRAVGDIHDSRRNV